ncbi:hypothetical protein JDV02_010039 [Purpureocillium takamizusanense]|nr:uncharacterized protein JDV02_010039 [Purpureocillium takamizusanense]UNI24281.1 hypothetical protein JDV02_010039 [Purpureocillium takamizusanense]
MMTACAFQLFFGRIYTFYSPKWCFIVSVAIFEIGSLVCAVAPSSAAFIIGRSVAGLGSAGIFSGSIVLTLHIVPLRLRPVYQSLMGAVILISTIIGPLIGGAFTTHVTWRWCFYVNLPSGGATILICMFLLPANPANPTEAEVKAKQLSIRQKIRRLDPIGTACFLPAIVCLILALQWGGTAYPWGNARIIVLWVLFGLLTIAFLAVQVWMGEDATIPLRIAKYRSVSASTWFAFWVSAALMTLVYWLPAWFQGIQGVDAVESGVRILPTILALVVSSIIAGGSVSRIGYYTPFLIACSVLMAIGAGLMTTFRIDTPKSVWIGYQVLFGFGVGLGQQQAGLAAQTVLPTKDVPIGVSFKFFGQQLGGAIFVSVGQNVFNDKLLAGLGDIGIRNISAEVVQNLGATELVQLSPGHAHEILIAYNDAITRVFMVGCILAALSLIGSLLTEWKSVKGKNLKGG